MDLPARACLSRQRRGARGKNGRAFCFDIMENFIGRVFGRLTVIKELPRRRFKSGKTERVMLCRCECGNEHATLKMHLKTGKTLSCGCLAREIRTTHGGSLKGKRVETLLESTYLAWWNMRRRATGKVMRKNYADRGIGMCEAWHSFPAFLDDLGVKPSFDDTLDRIDNDQGYYPENCRWVPMSVQNRNKRVTHMVTFKGETLCLKDMSKKHGVPYQRVTSRLRLGWSVSDALTLPKQAGKYHGRRVKAQAANTFPSDTPV